MALEQNTTIPTANYKHEMREARKKINDSNFSTWQKKRFNQILDEMDKKLIVYQENRIER